MPAPETAEAVPFFQQIATGAIIGLGSLGLMAWRFVSGKKKEPDHDTSSKVIVEQGTAIDLKPLLEPLLRIVTAVEGTRDDTHEVLKLARKEAEDDQVERKAEEMAERIAARDRKAMEDRFYEDVSRRLARLPKGND